MKKILFLILIGLVILPLLSASENLGLRMNKFSFSLGDDLQINLTINNKFSHEVGVEIHSLLSSLDKEFIVRPMMKRITIPSLQRETIELYSFKIDDNFRKGDYQVTVDAYSGSLKLGLDSILFKVREGLKEFDFNLNICKDSSCLEKAKIYSKNEQIFITYSSEISDPEIQATLIYPDKTKEQITLPSSFKAKQIGTYELEVTASKENYKTMNKKTQFGVIKKEADVVSENYKEKDLDDEDLSSENKTGRYIIYILIWFILLIVSVWIIKKARH